MRKEIYRFLVAFLTFIVGIVGVDHYRDYQRWQDELMWQESRLRANLFCLRRSIDEYAAGKGKLPQSLDDLVKAEYLEEVPFDPISRSRDWRIVVGNDPNSINGNQGIIDIHSTSSATSSQGTDYEEW